MQCVSYYVLTAVGATSVMLSGAHAQRFDFVGFGQGGDLSFVEGLSADGRTATGGTASRSLSTDYGMIWTRDGGLIDVVGPTTPSNFSFNSISDNGLVSVGQHSFDSGNVIRSFPYRYINSQLQAMGAWNNATFTETTGTNGDGSVVVGNSYYYPDESPKAFQWSLGIGYRALANPRPQAQGTYARDVSSDGRVVVGEYYINGFNRPCVWENGVPRTLRGPGQGEFDDGVAREVNSDGTIIVGGVRSLTGANEATIWRNDIATTLTIPRDRYMSSGAMDVSEDGSVVLGQVQERVSQPGVPTPLVMVVWVNSEFYRLDDYLRSHGIEVPAGWALYEPKSVSDDGRTFAGLASAGNGIVQGFVVSIPAPASLITLLPMVAWMRRTRVK